MKLQSIYFLCSLAILTLFSSCEVIGGIFEAGVWTGILVVVGVLALIIFLIVKLMKK